MLPRDGGVPGRLALALAVAALLAACDNGELERPIPRIPELRTPPPVPAAYREPAADPVRVVVRELLYVHETGAELELPRAEGVVELSPPGVAEALVRARRLELTRPRLTFPPDTVVTGLNLFMTIFEPGAAIDRLVVREADLGTLAAPSQAPGRWLWRLEGLNAVVEDVRLGPADGQPERLRIAELTARRGEVRGRPIRVEGGRAEARRTEDLFTAETALDLGFSRLRGDAEVTPEGAWSVDITGDTIAFAELRAFVRPFPRTGTGAGRVRIRGRDGRAVYTVERLTGQIEQSRLSARGTIAAGPEPALRGVVVELSPLRAQDFDEIAGVSLAGGGEWRGRLRADGSFRRGVDVGGSLVHVQPDGERSRIALDGTVRLQPRVFVDAQVTASPLRVADTTFHVALSARGPADSVALRANVTLDGPRPAIARVDALLRVPPGPGPPVVTGRARLLASVPPALADDRAPRAGDDAAPAPSAPPVRAVRARAAGSVVLAADGAVDVRIEVDTVPLALAPWPPEVEGVTGFVYGAVTVGGTLDSPRLGGRFRVRDGGFRVPSIGLVVDSLGGPILLEGDALRTPGITAAAGGGTLELTGRVGLRGARRLDLRLALDEALVLDTEDARVRTSGVLELEGPAADPRLGGRVRLVDGWAREDLFQPMGPLDLESPPYAELARRSPWPRDSRLARAEPPEGPPVQGAVDIVVTPEFSVVDEDSDLFGTGVVRVRLTEEGVDAEGDVRVLGGFYAFFGERFEVVGGTARFTGEGIEPRVGILAEHEPAMLLGSGSRGAPDATTDWFPPLEFLAVGPASNPDERLRRASLLPETQEQLAELLIYNAPPMPVTGWRMPLFWRGTDPTEVFGERAESQAIPLLWSYIGDEAYDFVPLRLGYLSAGTIRIGPRYPARMALGPVLHGVAVIEPRLRVIASQPLDGTPVTGLRARLDVNGGFVEAFSEPRFYAAGIRNGGHPGFFQRRRTGVGFHVEWRW